MVGKVPGTKYSRAENFYVRCISIRILWDARDTFSIFYEHVALLGNVDPKPPKRRSAIWGPLITHLIKKDIYRTLKPYQESHFLKLPFYRVAKEKSK